MRQIDLTTWPKLPIQLCASSEDMRIWKIEYLEKIKEGEACGKPDA